jgi:hypothetical protein
LGQSFRIRVALLVNKVGQMSVSKRKQKNTDIERQKKIQREKEQKKKQLRTGNIPVKGQKK